MIDIRPLRWEADNDAALEAIEARFVHEPEPGTSEADHFDLLAIAIADYERRHWEIDGRALAITASQWTLGDAVRAVFGPERGVDFDLPERGEFIERDPPDFLGAEWRLDR